MRAAPSIGARPEGRRGVRRARAHPDPALDRVRRVAARRGVRAAVRVDRCAPALLLVAGLVVSTAASFFLARALVRPIRALQEGAARIGAGELDQRIEVHTGDELEGLAEQFNQMGAAAAGVVRRPRAQGRAAHRRADRIAGAADRDQRGAEADQPLDLRARRRCCAPCSRARCGCAAPTERCCTARRRRQLRAVGVHTPLEGAERDGLPELLRSHPIRVDEGSAAGRAILLERPPCTSTTFASIPPTGGATSSTPRPSATSSRCRCCARASRSASIALSNNVDGRVVHAGPDRAGDDLRRPGRDRDRERAPVQRDQGGARAADRDRRDPAA